MRQYEAMDVFILHEGKVYAAHYKDGADNFCIRECTLKDISGGCDLTGHKRALCTKLDAYWEEVKA
jgi:hypothetical protein